MKILLTATLKAILRIPECTGRRSRPRLFEDRRAKHRYRPCGVPRRVDVTASVDASAVQRRAPAQRQHETTVGLGRVSAVPGAVLLTVPGDLLPRNNHRSNRHVLARPKRFKRHTVYR